MGQLRRNPANDVIRGVWPVSSVPVLREAAEPAHAVFAAWGVTGRPESWAAVRRAGSYRSATT